MTGLTRDERSARLNALDRDALLLLLSYLDGRAPVLLDEWFDTLPTRKS